MPRVLNKRTDAIPRGAIYIGRGYKWGNRFVIGVDGNRDEVIDKYVAWFHTSGLIDHLPDLYDADLVCWCKPKRCHGDFLLIAAQAHKEGRPIPCSAPTADSESS